MTIELIYDLAIDWLKKQHANGYRLDTPIESVPQMRIRLMEMVDPITHEFEDIYIGQGEDARISQVCDGWDHLQVVDNEIQLLML